MITLYSVPIQCNRWTVLTPFQGHPLCQSATERRLGISFWGLGIVLVLVSLKSGSVCVGPSFVSPVIHEDPSWSLTLWFSRAASVYHCVVKIACMILMFPQHEKCCAQTPHHITYCESNPDPSSSPAFHGFLCALPSQQEYRVLTVRLKRWDFQATTWPLRSQVVSRQP